LKDLVFGQAKINKSLTKKLTTNDKILENISSQIEGLTSAVKNQLSFNKMIETQLDQIASAIPVDSNGKIPAQPENSCESVKVVTTRGGKNTRDPPNPNQTARKAKEHQEVEPSTKEKEKEQEEVTSLMDFVNTSYLPFPTRNRKQSVGEQFARFVEMIEKIHVSVPLMDVLHVPSYAKYMRDIINNKRPLPSMEVVNKDGNGSGSDRVESPCTQNRNSKSKPEPEPKIDSGGNPSPKPNLQIPETRMDTRNLRIYTYSHV
jgi:hypothetical protein